MVSASVFAASSQRPCVTIAKLASSSPHSKDITCHENAGFARTMICLSRLAIELCLLLNIMRNGSKSKGLWGTCKACLPEHSQDCLGTFFLLSLHSLERTAFPRLTFHLFLDPGHDPRSFVTLRPLPPIAEWAALTTRQLHGRP